MHKLMEYICDELEELERKAEKDGKLSMAEIQYADTLAHMKKNLLKADEMWDDSEYSEDGGMRYSYERGGSNRGGRYSYESNRGSYARGGNRGGGRGQGARRNTSGRYSTEMGYSSAEDDMDGMISELREMMHELPEEKKHEVQKFIDRIERM